MLLILLGAPGSGKGTIASELHKTYGLVHISTGDIFRANMKEGTALGLQAKTYIDKGDLVPDSITIGMLEDRISQPDCAKGFMLDGFPRTIPQAEALEGMLQTRNQKIDAVVRIDISDEEIRSRVSGRRVCSSCGESYNVDFRPTKTEGVCDVCGGPVIHRDDDKPETVMARLKTYHEKTQPLIDFYEKKGLILPADNEESSKIALSQIHAAFAEKGLIS